jgi:hypothetical protein
MNEKPRFQRPCRALPARGIEVRFIEALVRQMGYDSARARAALAAAPGTFPELGTTD